ncbi:MAG: bifunctional phosphoribosylaminoimidazolecarboxamide formyltransferase/IMP cyclohydrolase, partial [Phycisphaeraceae bacterium]|nr:bifunctional phosphoribosylaminoimidazolecarboxamide formyltransferase/IMP cyclohydrolase [Phycisphaeraceae bacterium]
LLVQDRDLLSINADDWNHVAGPAPDDDIIRDGVLATLAVRHLKSNAVCLAADGSLVGAGPGQVDRVAACRLSIEKAGDRAQGSVAGSDAFFPFPDGPELLIDAGVKAIVQPGGSKRDDQTIEVCDKADVTLLMTGHRHFRH